MQFTKRLLGLFALATIASAASYNDVCNIGYCTLNGGTSGGSGGTVTTVTTLSALSSAVSGTDKRIVVVSGTITGTGKVSVGSNKSIIGLPGSHLSGVGLSMNNQTNVIFRNLKISKVVGGDGIGIQWSTKVWVDHCDVSSDRDHDIDYYDGAVDLTHATQYATLSYNYLHDHKKCVLVGADDSNTEDKVATVTFYGNYYNNLQTRTPMARFGTFHIVNNYFNKLDDSISTYMGAQMLVEYNVWESSVNTVKTSKTDTRGYAVVRNNNYGTAQTPNMTAGTFTTAPYSLTIVPLANVKANAQANAGQKLTF